MCYRTPKPEPTTAQLPDTTTTVVHQTLEYIQKWLADDRFTNDQLVIATQGAVAAAPGESVNDLVHAPLWGLLRTAQSEYPGRFILLDLDQRHASHDALPRALATGEPQLALRNGTLTIPHLTPTTTDHTLEIPTNTTTWQLDTTSKGTLDNLTLTPTPTAHTALTSGQVRIAVRAAGINFRDVLLTLDMVDQNGLGGEAAGIIIETAPDVTDFAVGDRVMGLMPGSFGPIAIANHHHLAPLPDNWTYAQGASVPIAFLTAYHGLIELANLQAGQSVLIHAATGGVGMAALQLAHHIGAEIHATASPAKHDLLHTLGLDENHISSSRSLEFEDRVRHATHGRGVDVVLNCLAREYVDASLRITSPHGHFLEMGKTDIRDAKHVNTNHPNLTYLWFDLLQAEPSHISRMLTQLTPLFTTGALHPLPTSAWDIRHAPQAMRHISQARHTGKLVLTMPPTTLDPDGTVLITGGTGTLGSLLARHLVTQHRVQHLLLLTRQGITAPGATDLHAELTAAGAHITITACDTTNRDALAHTLAAIPPKHPLTAIIHAAGLLDDALLTSLTPTQIDRVLQPKIHAAWNLHELTRDTNLAMFVLYSSTTAILGGPGQANYAAANAFLDALAENRRAAGLPTISIAWGLWQHTSTMTSHLTDTDLARLHRAGINALTDNQALTLFDTAITSTHAHLTATHLNTQALHNNNEIPPLLRKLIQTTTPQTTTAPPTTAGRNDAPQALSRRLASLTEPECRRLLVDLIRDRAALVLGYGSRAAIGVRQEFKQLGLDSLTAVELRNKLNTATGLRLPTTIVFDHPTPEDLATHLLEELAPAAAAPDGPQRSNDEIRRLLAAIDPERLRRSGLLEALSKLTDGTAPDVTHSPEQQPVADASAQLDDLGADDLINLAFGATNN
ncbi:SDR family NAD(P)-dependent oxidoreductase [Mycobacterium sp.]|uniref:SDR family NAD(P)-dependent oxidoreductase n=1 Tax=Mycobacterium sp. TaxID=1785 RepID=UPI003BA8461C